MEAKEISYKEYLEALNIVKSYKVQIENHYKEVENELEGISKYANAGKEDLITKVGLPIRAINGIKANPIFNDLDCSWYSCTMKVKHLERLSLSEIKSKRNIGKKSLDEIKELCFYAGVELKP